MTAADLWAVAAFAAVMAGILLCARMWLAATDDKETGE